MARYKLTATAVIVRDDGAQIPDDPANVDYAEYLAWVAGGGVPDPYVPPPPPVPQSVTRRQYYMHAVSVGWFTEAQALALISMGTLPPNTIAFVNSLPAGQQFAANMYLIGAANYERNNPLLISMTTAGGITSEFMDNFFRAAALL